MNTASVSMGFSELERVVRDDPNELSTWLAFARSFRDYREIEVHPLYKENSSNPFARLAVLEQAFLAQDLYDVLRFGLRLVREASSNKRIKDCLTALGVKWSNLSWDGTRFAKSDFFRYYVHEDKISGFEVDEKNPSRVRREYKRNLPAKDIVYDKRSDNFLVCTNYGSKYHCPCCIFSCKNASRVIVLDPYLKVRRRSARLTAVFGGLTSIALVDDSVFVVRRTALKEGYQEEVVRLGRDLRFNEAFTIPMDDSYSQQVVVSSDRIMFSGPYGFSFPLFGKKEVKSSLLARLKKFF